MSVKDRLSAVAGRGQGERIEALEQRIRELEEQVAENNQLHHRFAELLDVVTQLMVPLSQRDDAAVQATISAYIDELGS